MGNEGSAALRRAPSVELTVTRAVVLRPRDRHELAEWIIDRAQTMVVPVTRSRPRHDERVLLDLALDGERLWLPAVARYAVPESWGPVFVCAPPYRAGIALLLGAGRLPGRAHVRVPIALPASVSVDAGVAGAATAVDVSMTCARLRTPTPLSSGDVALHFPTTPLGFPAELRGSVIARRGRDTIIHFSRDDQGSWRALRGWLRRLDATGSAPLIVAG